MTVLLARIPFSLVQAATDPDPAPTDNNVKAGWLAFAIFLLLVAAVVVLMMSFVRHMRKVEAAKRDGVFDDKTEESETRSRREVPVILTPVRTPGRPRGVVLVLHGGASRGDRTPVSSRQLSVLRMIPTARAVVRAGQGRLAVFRVLGSYRGWDVETSPVDDAEQALDEVAGRYPGLPLGLIGHSLGGRAALLAGDHRGVALVVALNPWVYPDDDADLSGRRVLIVHGMQDRIAGPDRSELVARRLGHRANLGFVRIPEGKHAMLAHGREFDGYAAQFTAGVLLGESAAPTSGPVAQVLAGEEWVTA